MILLWIFSAFLLVLLALGLGFSFHLTRHFGLTEVHMPAEL